MPGRIARFLLPVLLATLGFSPARAADHTAVTFYPAYGYQSGDDWVIPLRAWVHEHRGLAAQAIYQVVEKRIRCEDSERDNLKSRLDDFSADDEHHESVTLEFDSDPDQERFSIGRTNSNGLIEKDLRLSSAKARKLLESQGSHDGWLTYHAVARIQTGTGRIRLIEREGTSVITDIDDTIKVTDVPAEKAVVLTNTFCRDFVAAPGMADLYKGLGDVPFHYVSGGPWQLYGPLHDFLIGSAGYPEGTFHLSDFPKNLLAKDTWVALRQTLANSLQKTYDHKIREIHKLMDQFPERKLILIGDSGEVDPEVYREILDKDRRHQVLEIRIRDVVNDAEVNPDRLKGMTIIKAEPILCASPGHYQDVAAFLKRLHLPPYKRNASAPCG